MRFGRAALLLPAAVASAAWLLGCPEKAPQATPAPARPGPRSGVKVPLPEGWTAQPGGGSLQVGPVGRPVLRIEPRPGAGSALPEPKRLAASLEAELRHSRLVVEEERAAEDASILLYALNPLADAGSPARPAMLGAKRVGEDLFLCSSIPGASRQEVELAAKACAELTVGPT